MTEDRYSDRIWRCDCGGHHFITLMAFDVGSQDQETYLTLCLEDRPDGLWRRIKAAFQILRHGKAESGDVLLTGQSLKEFQEEVARLVKADPNAEG
jgi:hypothetical protein